MKGLLKVVYLSLGILLGISSVSANTEQENAYLIRIVRQLDTLLPLIQAASQHHSNQRIIFHYDELEADVKEIRQGIIAKIKQTSFEPRVITPLHGDYLEDDIKPNKSKIETAITSNTRIIEQKAQESKSLKKLKNNQSNLLNTERRNEKRKRERL